MKSKPLKLSFKKIENLYDLGWVGYDFLTHQGHKLER